MSDFGSRLRQARKKLQLSQKGLGSRVGVSQSQISQWENGNLDPSSEQRKSLQGVLGNFDTPTTIPLFEPVLAPDPQPTSGEDDSASEAVAGPPPQGDASTAEAASAPEAVPEQHTAEAASTAEAEPEAEETDQAAGQEQDQTSDAVEEPVGDAASAASAASVVPMPSQFAAITGELKSKIDGIWTTFWNNGIANPITVIEQLSYLLFIKRLDDIHTAREKRANRLQHPIEAPIFGSEQQGLRWSHFKNEADATKVLTLIREEVFPFIKTLGVGEESSYTQHMKDAVFLITNAGMLKSVIEQLDAIPMKKRDTKGDIYEYMLSKIASAGQNGQFRTPRHIIAMMVRLVGPKPTDTICDPACGTAGFLVEAGEYLRLAHPELFHDKEQKAHFNNAMFYGFDFDATMLRIGSMNMMLHGIEDPDIISQDSLSQEHSSLEDAYTLVLANPPFKGSIDYGATATNLLDVARTKKTELLFLALILRILKLGGRAAVIVPDGVLFGSSKAHKAIRKALVESNKLEGVISMPSGVFKPYAGVSTAILLFTKTGAGGTDKVWFYDMEADGYSLDDKRDPVEANDIPDILAKWAVKNPEVPGARTDKAFFVPKTEIKGHAYDLSINRYKEIVYEEVQYDPPRVIIGKLRTLEAEIRADLDALEGVLG